MTTEARSASPAHRQPGPLVVAIDGPSGVGKSTVAKLLARRLALPYLETGAMYRALGLLVLESGIDPADRKRVAEATRDARIDLVEAADGGIEVVLEGRRIGERLRDPAVSEITSRISAYPDVRRRLVALQREWALRHGAVVEGRDIGTKVFPETPHKFFLEAPIAVRIQRRAEQLRAGGRQAETDEVLAEVVDRDRRDRERAESPLTRDESYQLLDTSQLAPEEVVERILSLIRAKLREAESSRC